MFERWNEQSKTDKSLIRTENCTDPHLDDNLAKWITSTQNWIISDVYVNFAGQ